MQRRRQVALGQFIHGEAPELVVGLYRIAHGRFNADGFPNTARDLTSGWATRGETRSATCLSMR